VWKAGRKWLSNGPKANANKTQVISWCILRVACNQFIWLDLIKTHRTHSRCQQLQELLNNQRCINDDSITNQSQDHEITVVNDNPRISLNSEN
jgi:hypothetical protein